MENVVHLQKEGFAAFKKIYAQYHFRLFNYIYAKTASKYMAEEVVQLTFIKLWERRGKLSVEIPVAAQIFRIANTTLIDLIRKLEKKNRLIVLDDNALEGSTEELLPSLFMKETKEKLETLLDAMPPLRSKVFRMSRLEELSHKEIAQKLSISTKTVENHITLAIKYIKPFFSQIFSILLLIELLYLTWSE